MFHPRPDLDLPWNGNHHRQARWLTVELESTIGAEEVLEASPRRRAAEALLQPRQCVLRQPDAVVADFHPQLVPLAAGGDVDVPGPALLRHAVLDCVLCQRLPNDDG